MSDHNAYEAAESLAHAAHQYIDMTAAIASGSADEGTFSLVVKGAAYTVIVRPLRYHEGCGPEELRMAATAVFDAAGNGEDALADALVVLGLVLASADSESREETP
jgi:hypothetical protein